MTVTAIYSQGSKGRLECCLHKAHSLITIKLQLAAAFLMLCPNFLWTSSMPSQTSVPYLHACVQSAPQASCPELSALWRFLPCRNEPNVHAESQEENEERWHGAELSVTILGNWQYYRSKVLK